MRSASEAWDSPASIRSRCTFRPTICRTSSDMRLIGQAVQLIATHYNAQGQSVMGKWHMKSFLGFACLMLTGLTVVGSALAQTVRCTDQGSSIVCDSGRTGHRLGNTIQWNDGSTTIVTPSGQGMYGSSTSPYGGQSGSTLGTSPGGMYGR